MPEHTAAAAPKPKRSDARRNRERILQAAMDVLGEKGVDAQMTDIAKAAALGVGTLYRNFPTKADLVDALVLERLDRQKAAAEHASQAEDAWEALVALLYRFAEHWLENRVLSHFLGGRITGSAAAEEQRTRTYALIGDLVKRAQRDGKLRKDVGITDIQIIHLAVAHLASSDSPLVHQMVMRHVGILIDGLRAPGTTKLKGRRPTKAESTDALRDPRGRGNGPADDALRRGRRAWPA